MIRRDRHLIDVAEAMVGSRFVWGETDCVSLSFLLLEVWTGDDWTSEHAGVWADPRSAIRRLRRDSTTWALESHLMDRGAHEIGPRHARLGDVVTSRRRRGTLLPETHLCLGAQVITSSPAQGVYLGELRDCWARPALRAFRVA